MLAWAYATSATRSRLMPEARWTWTSSPCLTTFKRMTSVTIVETEHAGMDVPPPPPPPLRAGRYAHLPPYDPSNDRLNLPLALRLPLYLIVASLCGGVLGFSHGARETGFRFRAENAHRVPTTQTGWYLYHKSKNYNMALGGIKEAAKMAGKLGVWVGLFVVAEEGIDRGRAGLVRIYRGLRGVRQGDGELVGNRDCISTTFAGLGTAGAFSAWNRHVDVPTTVRTAKMGAKVGCIVGICEDLLGLMRGRRIGYVDFIKKSLFGKTEDLPEKTDMAG